MFRYWYEILYEDTVIVFKLRNIFAKIANLYIRIKKKYYAYYHFEL